MKCTKNKTKKTDSKNSKVAKTNKWKLMILSKCVLFHGQKLKFIKEQEVTWFLSSLGIKTSLSKIPLIGRVLF